MVGEYQPKTSVMGSSLPYTGATCKFELSSVFSKDTATQLQCQQKSTQKSSADKSNVFTIQL